jgi:hypothetical protein
MKVIVSREYVANLLGSVWTAAAVEAFCESIFGNLVERPLEEVIVAAFVIAPSIGESVVLLGSDDVEDQINYFKANFS